MRKFPLAELRMNSNFLQSSGSSLSYKAAMVCTTFTGTTTAGETTADAGVALNSIARLPVVAATQELVCEIAIL